MMTDNKLIEVPVGRGCYYMLYPGEIRKHLPDELLEKGLKRGKAIRRRRAYQKRMGKHELTEVHDEERRSSEA